MYYRETNIGSYLRKQEDPGYCSLVTFREVFLWTKFTENPRIVARNHALHDFCASRSALLWTEWTVTDPGCCSRIRFRQVPFVNG